MYVFYNNNPHGLKVGDCVIRAISAAMGETWERIYIDLCIEGYMMHDMPNANAVWDSYLRYKGFKKSIVDKDYYTVSDFADEHSDGVYVLATGSHAVCVNCGEILDSWDSSNEIITYYYEKRNNDAKLV